MGEVSVGGTWQGPMMQGISPWSSASSALGTVSGHRKYSLLLPSAAEGHLGACHRRYRLTPIGASDIFHMIAAQVGGPRRAPQSQLSLSQAISSLTQRGGGGQAAHLCTLLTLQH